MFKIFQILLLLSISTHCRTAYCLNQIVDDELKCGVILPLTGNAAEWGYWVKGGIEIASEGYDNISKKFIYEDDQYVPSKTTSALRKLIDIDKINCLITLGSSTSLAVQSIAEQNKLPMFAIAITPKVGEGLEYVMRYYIPIENQVTTIVNEIKRREYKKIAILTSEHDATLPLTEGVVNAKIVETVYNEKINSQDQSLATLAIRVKSIAPDAVFINLIPPLPSIFSRRLREVGYKGEMFSGPTLESIGEVKSANGALEGAWFITVDESNASEFISNYKARYQVEPGMIALYAHDIAKIILSKPKSLSLNEYAKSVKNFNGLAGEYSWNGKEFDIPAAVWVINGNTFSMDKNKE